MLGVMGRRLAAILPVLLFATFGVFLLIELVPGDPSVALAGGENATEERIAEVREELRLDDPLIVRYLAWLGDTVRFDLGDSLVDGRPVLDKILNRLPITISIALSALVVGVIIGVTSGVFAGMRPGQVLDRLTVVGASIGLAVPNFLLAMIFISVFAIEYGWFPALGFTRITDSFYEWLKSVTLPAISLGLLSAATISRQLRASLIDVMSSHYVRTAWAKGSGPYRAVGKHALKNAAMPVVTVLGLQVSVLIGGSVIIEQIFSIPGLGTFLLQAVLARDLPVIQGVVIFFAILQVVLMFLVDMAYGILNPKVRVT